MRDITKSMLSYTWAMSVFGVQQAANLLRRGQRQDNRATEVFDGLTAAVSEQFDDTLKAAFRAGDNLQRGMVDLMFGGLGVLNTEQWARSAERMAGAAGQATRAATESGWAAGRGWTDDRMPSGSSFGRGPSPAVGGGSQTGTM